MNSSIEEMIPNMKLIYSKDELHILYEDLATYQKQKRGFGYSKVDVLNNLVYNPYLQLQKLGYFVIVLWLYNEL